MQAINIKTDAESLARLGAEAVDALCRGDFRSLAQRFGYMRAFDREQAGAIESDVARTMTGSTRLLGANHSSVSVKYFEPNDIPLFALVECRVATDAGPDVLLELVVVGGALENRLSIEDITQARSVDERLVSGGSP